jgi:hypothetical protein
MQAEATSSIDLSLAVNYLPACSCAAKSSLLSLALCAVHSLRLVPAYAALGLLLVFDRLLQGRACILDGSSVLLGIFAAHAVSEVQESGTPLQPWDQWAFWTLSAEWATLSGYRLYLCGAGQVKPLPASSRRAVQQWEFLGACAHVALCAFHRSPQFEPRGLRVARYTSFAFLCVCWTYVIGIYLRRVTSTAADSAVHFASYFWPVLYVHPYVAAAYAAAVLAGVALHLRPPLPALHLRPPSPVQQYCPLQESRHHQLPPLRLELISCEEAESLPGTAPAATAPGVEEPGADAESLEELERVFRMAMQSQAA